MIKKFKLKNLIYGFIAILFWLLLWQIASIAVNRELILPNPLQVLLKIFEFLSLPLFYKTVFYSLGRVMLGMLLGVLIGVLGGFLTAFSKIAKAMFSPILSIAKSTPIASFIILLFLWLSRDAVACVISALIVFPIVWSNVETGITSTDKKLLEMACAYKMTASAKIMHVYLPSTLPYFIASIKSSLGMSWKAGIAAEALILPSISIGKQIFESKYNLDTVALFAWTVVVIILSIIIEKLLVLLLNILTRKSYGAGGNTNA